MLNSIKIFGAKQNINHCINPRLWYQFTLVNFSFACQATIGWCGNKCRWSQGCHLTILSKEECNSYTQIFTPTFSFIFRACLTYGLPPLKFTLNPVSNFFRQNLHLQKFLITEVGFQILVEKEVKNGYFFICQNFNLDFQIIILLSYHP